MRDENSFGLSGIGSSATDAMSLSRVTKGARNGSVLVPRPSSLVPVPDETDERHAKLRKATRALEAYFVGTLLKKMHESASQGEGSQDSASATYREMFDEAIAEQIGKTGAFGIGDMLYKELVVSIDGKLEARKA